MQRPQALATAHHKGPLRTLSRLALGVAIASIAAIASAQPSTPAVANPSSALPDVTGPPPALDTRDLSEADRKAYAKTIKEARELIAQEKYDDAIAKLDALSKDHPREPQARFLKGVALTDQGKTEEAAVLFRAMISDFPEMPEPHNNLAVLYAKRGELVQARAELEIAVHAAPDYAVAHENLGDIYIRLAADEYAQAADLDKRSRTASAKPKLARAVTAPSP